MCFFSICTEANRILYLNCNSKMQTNLANIHRVSAKALFGSLLILIGPIVCMGVTGVWDVLCGCMIFSAFRDTMVTTTMVALQI